MSQKFATVRELLAGGEKATAMVQGWVKTKRDSKAGISFIHVSDGSCHDNLQIVASNEMNNYASEISKLTAGCAIQAEGSLVKSSGKNQALEMQASKLVIIGNVADPATYPIQPKRHTMEYLREVAHLRPRTNTIAAMSRVRHALSKAIHDFLHSNGFLWVHTPIITASDCEGAGDLFRVSTLDTIQESTDYSDDFFSAKTFLTVSGQLNVEAYCMALSKVYTFGPTFRAENSNTSRHLAEFWMVEPEIAFADLNYLSSFCEKMLKAVVVQVVNECATDMQFFNSFIDKGCLARLDKVINSDFTVMTYSEAIAILTKQKHNFEFELKWGVDLQSEHERYLTEKICQNPVIVTEYPKDIKGFYMRQNDDGKTVAAMDVLVPGIGEIVGGSQREERYQNLLENMQKHNLSLEQYGWYLDLRKYGSVPHSGFGIGLERLLGYITGITNVRDLIPFPRVPRSAKF